MQFRAFYIFCTRKKLKRERYNEMHMKKMGEYDGEKYDRRETFKIDTGFYASGFDAEIYFSNFIIL